MWHSFSLYLPKIVRKEAFPLFGCMLKHTMCELRVCLNFCLWSSLHGYILNCFFFLVGILRIRIIFYYYNIKKNALGGKEGYEGYGGALMIMRLRARKALFVKHGCHVVWKMERSIKSFLSLRRLHVILSHRFPLIR